MGFMEQKMHHPQDRLDVEVDEVTLIYVDPEEGMCFR